MNNNDPDGLALNGLAFSTIVTTGNYDCTWTGTCATNAFLAQLFGYGYFLPGAEGANGYIMGWGSFFPPGAIPISALLPDCDYILGVELNAFLTAHKSPLFTQDPDFVGQVIEEAASVNVDPRLFVAETEESGLGTSNAATNLDNPFGLKDASGNINFSPPAGSGVGQAVIAEGKTLNKFVNKYDFSVSQMYSGLPGIPNPSGGWTRPPAYCQSPGCQSTGQAISKALQAMGGDPNKLNFPSGQVGATKCH